MTELFLSLGLIAAAIIALFFGIMSFRLNQDRKKTEREKEDIIAGNQENIEKKESMETGSSSTDFESSINILSELAKRNSK